MSASPGVTTWRWDQGRLDYFQFDVIRNLAKVLSSMEGVSTSIQDGDPLRPILTSSLSLPFAPASYSVWRNYGRVFELELLAVNIDNKLVCTPVCHWLAEEGDDVTVDEYLTLIARRFYYSSPVFEDYDATGRQLFPFCGLLKFLVGRALDGKPLIEIKEVFSDLIGNEWVGTEGIDFFRKLSKTSRTPKGDELRQVREMVRFISQFTFLKWDSPYLYLDVFAVTDKIINQVAEIATPNIKTRQADRVAEMLILSERPDRGSSGLVVENRLDFGDREFVEGKKIRVAHLRSERSQILKKLFFKINQPPYLCDMCEMNLNERYPWAQRLVELHHLLPLASPLRVESGKTSLRDIVGICPTCHRATHKFYSAFLKGSCLSDFRSYDEARDVYGEAKKSVVM